ncbi:peroxisomal short-chain alcohol dehydrogenase [Fusarium sporotrichioides]|uniref:Peroxisomal short-chain alcohol dehydrogenase n=1 Tax=Fusarium sporotrichioides TaxID=5514 RepID=A0A395RKF2_FUSSP|nr:peroxisomal short-chain alcohol dehydrogenase [Fusarium sporotrichioides]
MANNTVQIGYRLFPITEKAHKAVYPAISPSKPSLSQAGKTILITGATRGIGFETARSFATAGAGRVIIIGRDESKAKSAAEALSYQSGSASTRTVFEDRSCEITSPTSVDRLWDELDTDGITVDVIVLNAALTSQFGKMTDLGWEEVWKAYEVNVRSSHQFCDRLRKQVSGKGRKKYVVNISTSAIHDFPAASYSPSYSLTKNSAALLLQLLARELPASEMQFVSLHPGAILTPAAAELGVDETTLDWDDISLPSSAAVWAASDEAAFLHGRFIWSMWDVEELASGELGKRLESDENFLRVGVHGLEYGVAK